MSDFKRGVFFGLTPGRRQPDEPKEVTEIWRLFELGREHHSSAGLYETTERAHRFFEGEQWSGLESGGELLPMYNFIAPTCEYKIAMVAMKSLGIEFSQVEGAEVLSGMARELWEATEMDKIMWEVVKEACIAGDGWLFFYDRFFGAQTVDNVNIYLGDEQQRQLQKQPYIIIYERRPISEIRSAARQNGILESEIENIVPDGDTRRQSGETDEVKSEEHAKCSSLLYMRRNEQGDIAFTRATRRVVYQPERVVSGMKRYPLACFVWLPKKGSARGRGEVEGMIPNQIECNRLLARRALSAKISAFARPVYSTTALANPQDIDKVGAALGVNGIAQRIDDAFRYIQPAGMSPDAHILQEELIDTTQRMASTGSAALGNTDPEKASGAAIIAARDQSALPLNEQTALFRQFVEDVARIWYDMLCAYHPMGGEPGGLPDGRGGWLDTDELKKAAPSVAVDIENVDPISRYAREQVMRADMEAGRISFEEFVEALPPDSVTPKAAYREIIADRAQNRQILPVQGWEQSAGEAGQNIEIMPEPTAQMEGFGGAGI
jgi:hypothetical protein